MLSTTSPNDHTGPLDSTTGYEVCLCACAPFWWVDACECVTLPNVPVSIWVCHCCEWIVCLHITATVSLSAFGTVCMHTFNIPTVYAILRVGLSFTCVQLYKIPVVFRCVSVCVCRFQSVTGKCAAPPTSAVSTVCVRTCIYGSNKTRGTSV